MLTISILYLSLVSCNFSYSSESSNSTDPASLNNMDLAKKALRYIETEKADSLLSLLNSSVRQKVKKEQIDWLIKEGKSAIQKSTFPNDTSVIISKSVNFSLTGKKEIEMLSFPFQSKTQKDSIKYFHFTIADNEIHRLLLNDYPPGMRIIEPTHNEPHMDKHKLSVTNISWFRIWYDDGSKINKRYGNNTGYYAVSGDKGKLKNIGIEKLFQEIFDLINNATYDSTDFKYLREDEKGDPEWIYLRLKFDNPEYKNLGEFEISCFLDEEEGKREIMSDFIVFKHTDKTRYLFLKDKNQRLVDKLKELGHHDYGKHYELFP